MSNNCKFCGVDVSQFRWCQNQACKLYNRRVPAVLGFAFGSELCKRCDGLLSSTNPCPECLQNEPGAILRRFEQADKDALRAELGYSSEVTWRVFNEDAAITVGKKWKGYKLELLGVELGRYSEWPIPPKGLELYEQIGAIARRNEGGYDIIRPWLLLPFDCIHVAENPDLIIKLCRMRALYKNSPLYSEMRPHAFGVRRVAIHGLEHKHKTADLDRAIRGLDLLRAARKKLGRPEGTRFYARPEFVAASVRAYRVFYERTEEHPKARDIYTEMGLSKAAYYDALREYGLHLNDIRAAALND